MGGVEGDLKKCNKFARYFGLKNEPFTGAKRK